MATTLSALTYSNQDDSEKWTKLQQELTRSKTKVSKTITKYITSLKDVSGKYDKSKITFGAKSFLDQQIGQALQGLQEVQGALDAKVKEVTLFLERIGVPPQIMRKRKLKAQFCLH